jgi:hypothetical protein
MGRKRYAIILGLVILVDLLALSPLLECGFNGDDLISSVTPGILAETGNTAWSYFGRTIGNWLKLGRFYPLAYHYIFFFSVVRSLHVYRWVGMGMLGLNLLLFARFISRTSGSRRLGLLGALLLPVFFQFRFYHDPILSFGLLLQLVFTFLVCSLTCLDSYLRSGRPRCYFGSVLFFLLALLTYEVTYPFFVLNCVLIYWRRAGNRPLVSLGKLLAPFVLLPALILGVCALARSGNGLPLLGKSQPNPGNPYTEAPDLGLWLPTLAKQTAAALPLTYLGLVLQERGDFSAGELLGQVSAPLLWSAVGWVALAGFLLKSPREFRPVPGPVARVNLGTKRLLVVGVLLTVLPGVLMALVPRYQRELVWGLGYLPVYLSAFGIATGVVAFFRWAMGRCPNRRGAYPIVAASSVAVLAAVLVINGAANRFVIGLFNLTYHYHLTLLEEGSRHGLFGPVPDGSCLVVANRPVSNYTGGYFTCFFRTYAQRHLDVRLKGAYLGDGPALTGNLSAADRVYYLRYAAPSTAMGVAILGRCTSLAATGDEIRRAAAGQVYVYVRLPNPRVTFSVRGKWAEAGSPGTAEGFVLEGSQLGLEAGGPGWRLCELPLAGRPVDLGSLRVDFGTVVVAAPAAEGG